MHPNLYGWAHWTVLAYLAHGTKFSLMHITDVKVVLHECAIFHLECQEDIFLTL